MKIPYEFAPRVCGATGDIDTMKRHMRSATHETDGTQFRVLLREVLQPATIADAGRLEYTPLVSLIETIHRQMHDHMLCALLDHGGCAGVALSDGCGPHPAAPVSINQRSVQKIDDGDAGASVAIDAVITEAVDTYGVDENLLRAIIKTESDFNPNSTSDKGAMGLMQLMPATAAELGVANPYDPAENVMAGTKYLKMLLDRYHGDRDLTLAAYNWGMGNVERHPAKLPEETKNYIARIERYCRSGTG